MKLLIKLIVPTISVLVAGYIIPGVSINGWFTALVVAIVLGALNVFIKPLIMILTLPINVVTLGLFTFFVNAGLVYLTSYIVPGFDLASLWTALFFGIAMSLINSFLSMFLD